MNIIFLNWACFCATDTCEALINLGHKVQVMQIPDKAHTEIDEAFIAELCVKIKDFHCDAVFSLNYFPTVSVACMQSDCRYISWIYDNPQTKVYDKTAVNECNHIFTFDSFMADQLNARGVATVAYAPLAANVKRLTSPKITPAHIKKYGCEISFVGSLYNEAHNFYDRLIKASKNEYLEGFLSAVIEAQKRVFGYNFMAEALTEEVVNTIREHMPYIPAEGSFIREAEIYADYYLARKLAYFDRLELLYCLGEYFDVHHYTHTDKNIGKVKNRGKIDYFNEMPFLFRISKINLNPTLRSIKNGIPLRSMDILGCGGFLLTNFQSDFLRHFEPDKHFVAYSSLDEALDKCDYYIAHEEERTKIAANALEIMTKEHTFEVRLAQILSDVFK